MASLLPAPEWQRMILCSFCQELFKTLLTFDGCKHRICCFCARRIWGRVGAARHCPQCSMLPPARDTKDKGQADGDGDGSQAAAPEPEQGCQEHQEALELFCLEDQTPICALCTESLAHRTHTPVPIEEAAEEYKVRRVLQSSLLERKEVSHSFDVALLRSENIQAQKQAVVSAELQDTYNIPTIRIFEFLNQFKVQMTLDPKSAHPSLLLSEDGQSVSHGGARQELPDYPERFDPYVFVLGSLRITAGRCYWEVEVGDQTEWDIGVCREAVKRKGKGPLSPQAGFWRMWLRNGDQYKVLLSHPITLSVKQKPKRVGIYLDYKGGEVSFYNVTHQTHLEKATILNRSEFVKIFCCHFRGGAEGLLRRVVWSKVLD
uniref:Uncharacterized protein n=1 Tax=Anser cygnoides TaxID=8845 RepID=A0A8B9EA65_ANSCY